MTRRWLIDLPTRVHLWSAEFQIRHRSSADPERLRNLDVLRDYRKSRAFPRNDTGLPSTPYFVDRDGRHCAVGHLMRESGEHDAVRRIAATANLARIDDMDPAVLADWTKRSGLTKRELARIQPQYPNESQWAVDLLLWSALLMIPLALLSFVLGRIRLDRTALRRGLAVVAVGLCTVLTFLMSAEIFAWSGWGAGVTGAWGVVQLGPIVVAVVIAVLARQGRIREVAPVSGVLTGALMTVFAAVYLVLDVVVPNPSEPGGDVISMGPDQPILSAPPALLALVLGVLTLGWAVRALRWRVRV
ncbi:hypothetical protein OHB24_00135 [Kribbella sp. NBC_00482]|uniref:hypothetical protein n=1 Tax=Kribbella sp. NBC_00482 TaxID=2975968 RepID=UPI002E17AE4E